MAGERLKEQSEGKEERKGERMGVFKAYDVRGIYPQEIDEALFTKIGQAAVKVLKAKTMVVGRDARLSSPSLAQAMIAGICSAGADVIDIGMASTPMLYLATAILRADAGVQITASHNPGRYNGCKWCRADAVPVSYETGLADMEKAVVSGSLPVAAAAGKVRQQDIGEEYRRRLLGFASGIGRLRVVIDAGNGVMGAFLPPLLAKLPCDVIPLYFQPDGNFPNHEANPLKRENLRDLIRAIREKSADLGVAFDGDGDRCCFVDETGEPVPADFITALLAREVLSREPGATVLYDLRSSWVCKEEIERLGGCALMSRVGHSYIKEMMRKHRAAFAGELSGHFYFRDLHYTDNAEMAMLMVLAVLSREKKRLSELVAPLRRYFATGEINFTVADKDKSLAAVEAALAAGGEVIRLDGLSLVHRDWWCNVRPSNTEPVLRLNLEARTAALRDEMRQRVEKAIGGKPADGHA
ncbi:MAG: phosphomannomutase/phosphoglucomutase [Planctomycetota bacterium]|nr:phosphomannomutase/phosphoglucomutase [Planctomycetota bacterium]